MKQKILLLLAASVFFVGANAQKKSKAVTAYAITAAEKGNSKWTEVRLVDLNTGEEVKSIYNSSEEIPTLNARTGQPVVKNETALKSGNKEHEVMVFRSKDKKPMTEAEMKELMATRKLNGDEKIRIERKINVQELTELKTMVAKEPNVNVIIVHNVRTVRSNAPFATQSAACAYDKKHERLYYTPMGINQLRYIDLKSKTPQIFYFENEPLGALSGPGDVANQVTRMVIGGDGNGYALTNNGDHLIRFTTNKKAEITDLGSLTDDGSNGRYSVHSGGGFGGDMVADNKGSLYLITANRAVFHINIESRVATYKGSIKGLPKGFTTNGAVVEKGTNIIVTSSTSTSGYYMFDLNTLQAKKVSESETVYNASDLANSNLISAKKVSKEEKPVEEEQPQDIVQSETPEPAIAKRPEATEVKENKITLYPNPVTNNLVNLSFNDYAAGRYEIQVLDLNGKVIQTQNITISSKTQVQEVKLPSVIAKGNYFVKVVGENGRVVNLEKLMVQ